MWARWERPRRSTWWLASLLLMIACGGGGDDGGTAPPPPTSLPLERYDAGFFTLDKPKGWTVTLAGRCSTFAFLAQDPTDPRWQVFYFGTIGPVYTSQQQKELDEWYVAHGGFAISWIDAPVVDPLTAQNFFAHWPAIADMDAAVAFMTRFPRLANLSSIASAAQDAMLPNGHTAHVRGLFTVGDEVAEGMFLATVVPFFPYNGNPGAGNAYGHLVCGISAPQNEFDQVSARLIDSLESFSVTQDYVDGCLAEQHQIWGAVAAAGRTLSEASDILWNGWQARSHGEDILAEQWTDAYRGVERVYDPATGTVFEVPAGWYEQYDRERALYDMDGLQPLPDGAWDLWMRTALDGSTNVH